MMNGFQEGKETEQNQIYNRCLSCMERMKMSGIFLHVEERSFKVNISRFGKKKIVRIVQICTKFPKMVSGLCRI